MLHADPDALRTVNVATNALDEEARSAKRAKSDPSVDNFLQLSIVDMQNGRFEEGIAACREAVRLRPEMRGLSIRLIVRFCHRQLLRSDSSEGASVRWISRPLTMERKLFHPASTTWTTWTAKNPRNDIVIQKCSQRAIS